jgi:hypothetical protein
MKTIYKLKQNLKFNVQFISLQPANKQILRNNNEWLETVIKPYFFSYGATAPIWALAYLHETLRFISVF